MKNAYYYIFLCIISTIFFIYSLVKKKDKRLIAYYFFIAGLTYLLEYFTLVLFNGYDYYPGVLKNQYFDNILGAVCSDAFTIPMIAVFVAAFRLSFGKVILISVIITLVEILFVKIKIYEQHWWRYYYTLLGAIIVYYFGPIWFSMLKYKISAAVRFITLFLGNLLIQNSLVFIVSGILGMYFYKLQWFANPYRSHVAFASFYIILITLLFVSTVVLKLKWYWASIAVLLPSITDIILFRMNVLVLSDKWNLLSFVVLRVLIFISIHLFDRYILTEKYEGLRESCKQQKN